MLRPRSPYLSTPSIPFLLLALLYTYCTATPLLALRPLVLSGQTASTSLDGPWGRSISRLWIVRILACGVLERSVYSEWVSRLTGKEQYLHCVTTRSDLSRKLDLERHLRGPESNPVLRYFQR